MFLFRDSLPNMNAKIRLLHGAAGAKPVDVYSDGDIISSNLNFGEITSYIDISPGKHKFEIYETGKKKKPLFSHSYEIVPREILTLNAVFIKDSLKVFPLKDNYPRKINDLSFLRFINLSPDSPLLSLSLDNNKDILFNGVEYLETTGFYPFSPKTYNFVLSETPDNTLI